MGGGGGGSTHACHISPEKKSVPAHTDNRTFNYNFINEISNFYVINKQGIFLTISATIKNIKESLIFVFRTEQSLIRMILFTK